MIFLVVWMSVVCMGVVKVMIILVMVLLMRIGVLIVFRLLFCFDVGNICW